MEAPFFRTQFTYKYKIAMSKKRSNRPFHGHGSFEEEFEFEEVAMSDEPKGDARGESRKKAKKTAPTEEIWSDAEVMDEKEIDAVVAEISNAQPKIKKSRRRGARKEQHIAANPSVNPTQTRTSIIDGVKIANTRLRVSVEDEMKTHGIKKLPNGISAADLAIPSYDSVVTSAERRPLDCALYHEFSGNELSPLEQMMRKSAERSEKSKKKEQKVREEKNSKQEKKPEKEKKDCKTCDGFHGCKGCRKAEKYAQAKVAENAGEKAGKQAEKEQSKAEKRERKHEKKSREDQPQIQHQTATAAPVSGTVPAPTVPVTQVQPAFYQTQAQGMDAHRAELLKQQEMVLQMIQQCHQTLASIQAQLLSVVPQPMIQPVVTPVAVPVPAPIPTVPAVPTVPVQASILESKPSDVAEPVSAPASASENVLPVEGASVSADGEKAERKISRRERIRMKKQREAQVPNESEISEKTEAEEKAPTLKENRSGKKPEKKPEKISGEKAENQGEKPGIKKPAKFEKESKESKELKESKGSKDSRKSFGESSISDVISAYPDEFIGPEDFDEEFHSDSADHKKKIKKPFMVWKKPKKR